MSWNSTREAYLNWLAENEIKSFFEENIRYDNISLWWETKLNQRDNISDANWYKKLNLLLDRKSINEFAELKDSYKCQFYLFLKDLVGLLYVLIYSKTRTNNINSQNKIWFNIMDYNLETYKSCLVDRNYLNTPLHDKEFGYNTIYLLRTFISFKDILQSNVKAKYASFVKLDRPFLVLDEYISIIDLIKIYLKVYF